MDFAPAAAMVTLVISIINFIKFIKSKDTNAVVTQLAVWIAGVLVINLVAHSDFGKTLKAGDYVLGNLNGWSLLFVGLSVGSVALFANDLKKAVDSSDTAKKPPLVGPPGE